MTTTADSTTTTPAPLLAPPRTPHKRLQRNHQRSNFEMYAWLFMRASGVLLIFLVIGHLIIMNMLDGGVGRINWAFVAGRWSSPFWRIWDLSMLVLAELHGTNGLRTVINDYARRDLTRFWLKTLLYSSTFLVVALGSLVIFTFDPSLTS